MHVETFRWTQLLTEIETVTHIVYSSGDVAAGRDRTRREGEIPPVAVIPHLDGREYVSEMITKEADKTHFSLDSLRGS